MHICALTVPCPAFSVHESCQSIQNCAAHLILKRPQTDYMTPLLQSFLWFPIPPRIQYKINTVCYNCYHMFCSILSLWLSSVLLTPPYCQLCFWCSQPPDLLYWTFHSWFPCLFHLRPSYMEWPAPPSLKETLSGLVQIQAQNSSFSKM